MAVSVFCSPNESQLLSRESDRLVRLYGPASENYHGIGNAVRDDLKKLTHSVTVSAFDFLSIALSVVAADEFVDRNEFSDDGFGRQINLTVAVAAPERWQDKTSRLNSILNFLTGDTWKIDIIRGGFTPPSSTERNRVATKIPLSNKNAVCLFSGGLDSLIGAVEALNSDSMKPLLVSRASTGDHIYQQSLLDKLGKPDHFHTNDAPRSSPESGIETEGSTRSRSILFIALAVCCGTAISNANGHDSTPLLIPENGVIALNAPLTKRRIGASSTRTAHPHYIGGLQQLFSDLGIKVNLENPYIFKTKGEMISGSNFKSLIEPLIEHSVSCGKFKRRNQQCGICVPCLIRRSANLAASIDEPADLYCTEDISTKVGLSGAEEDIFAVRYALANLSEQDMTKWVLKSGPLPLEDLDKHASVAWRGLNELRDLFEYWGISA